MTFDYFKNSQLIDLQSQIHDLNKKIDIIVNDRRHKLGLISESTLEEIEMETKYFPENFYHFSYGITEIKICRINMPKFQYSIFVKNFIPSHLPIWQQYSLKQNENHFGCFDSLAEAYNAYSNMIINCLEQHIGFTYKDVCEVYA